MLSKAALRIRNYKETLEIIEPYISKCGISRVAELTQLDNINIPVFAAIRPLAKSIAVSQGKGFCKESAQCSAIMESIEVYWAENVSPYLTNKNEQQLRQEKRSFLSVNRLGSSINYLDECQSHNWVEARLVFSNISVLIPHQVVCLDSTNEDVLMCSLGSTGLASGNTFDEAFFYSVCENIERSQVINELEVDFSSSALSKKLKGLQECKLFYLKNCYGVPCFRFEIRSLSPMDNQVIFFGTAAHPDKNVAIEKAFLEAVQSRMTVISGARDDLENSCYKREIEYEVENTKKVGLDEVKSWSFRNLKESAQEILQQIKKLDKEIVCFTYLEDEISIVKTLIINRSEIFL